MLGTVYKQWVSHKLDLKIWFLLLTKAGRTIKETANSDSWLSVFLVLTLSTIVLLIRKTDAFYNPQLWAEDGAIFFLQQYENGTSAIFQPYAGYIHLIPRLIATFSAAFFNYYWIPFVYNFFCLAMTLFVIGNVFSRRLKINYKPLIALTIVLVPHANNEVFLNVTNIQWILYILQIITLLKEKPDLRYARGKIQLILDVTIIVLCRLTGPFIIFLAPFFMWKWFRDRNSATYIPMITSIAISLVQMFFLVREPGQLQVQNIVPDLNVLSEFFGHKVFGSLFFLKFADHKFNSYFLSAIYFVLLFTILKFSSAKNRFFVFVCLCINLITLLAAYYKFRSVPKDLIPVNNGLRYFYVPYVMLSWSLIVSWGQKKKWKDGIITASLTLILISSLNSGLQGPKFIDYNWAIYSQSIGKKDVVIPINPRGWHIQVKAQPQK